MEQYANLVPISVKLVGSSLSECILVLVGTFSCVQYRIAESAREGEFRKNQSRKSTSMRKLINQRES